MTNKNWGTAHSPRSVLRQGSTPRLKISFPSPPPSQTQTSATTPPPLSPDWRRRSSRTDRAGGSGQRCFSRPPLWSPVSPCPPSTDPPTFALPMFPRGGEPGPGITTTRRPPSHSPRQTNRFLSPISCSTLHPPRYLSAGGREYTHP